MESERHEVEELKKERDEAKEKLLEAVAENKKLRRKLRTRARIAVALIRQRRVRRAV